MPQPSPDVLKAGGNKVKAVLPVESGGCVYKARGGGGLPGKLGIREKLLEEFDLRMYPMISQFKLDIV